METNRNARILIGVLILIILGLFYDRCSDQTAIGSKADMGVLEEHLIPIELADRFKREYMDTRWRIINDSLFRDSKRKDTREFTFSLKVMDSYIAYVKEQIGKDAYDDYDIRIDFSAYPENFDDPRGDPGFSTAVLVPVSKVSRQEGTFMPFVPPFEDAKALNFANGGPK